MLVVHEQQTFGGGEPSGQAASGSFWTGSGENGPTQAQPIPQHPTARPPPTPPPDGTDLRGERSDASSSSPGVRRKPSYPLSAGPARRRVDSSTGRNPA